MTGLQYNDARWYDPSTGRWMSQDPMGFVAGDSNLYRYVNNSPIDGVDPSGKQPAPQRGFSGGINQSYGDKPLYPGMPQQKPATDPLVPVLKLPFVLQPPGPSLEGNNAKVTNNGVAMELPNGEKGLVDVMNGPKGVISVMKGVRLSILNQANNVFEDFSVGDNKDLVSIDYTPERGGLNDLDFVQFIWIEIKEEKAGVASNVGIPANPITGAPKNTYMTTAGQLPVTLNPRDPVWAVDVRPGFGTISYVNASGAGFRGKTLRLFDAPDVGQFAFDANVLNDKPNDMVTSRTVIMHFKDYLVYKRSPIYMVSWTASATANAPAAANLKVPPVVYELVANGCRPVTALDAADIEVLNFTALTWPCPDRPN